MDKINNKFIKAIEQYHMLGSGDHVTVALSGGADSVALLLLLLKIQNSYSLTLSAAHLNHEIRGKDADADETFVKELCNQLQVPLQVGHCNIPAICQESGESIELAARRVRYAFLQDCAKSGKIATAHTLSDNTETVLFNLARGTGIKGLCGIPPIRENIIRPLILIDGQEIRDYLDRIGQKYVLDQTNFNTNYSRNRIRHAVIPELQKVNPALHQNVMTCSNLFKEDEDFLTQRAIEALNQAKCNDYLQIMALTDLHRAILSRVLRIFTLENTGQALDRRHTEKLMALIDKGAGREEIGADFVAELLKGRLYIEKPAQTDDICTDRQILLKLCNKDKVNNLLLKNTIDYDKIGDNLSIRKRQNGDKFKAAGRGVTKSLKKLLNEAAIPPAKRDHLIILADDNGIVWLEGFGTSERCVVTDETQNILVIEYN